jgi:hypothetical protein
VPNLQSQKEKLCLSSSVESNFVICFRRTVVARKYRQEINETKQVHHFELDEAKTFSISPACRCYMPSASTFYGRLRANLAACLMFVLPASKTQLRQQREEGMGSRREQGC